MANLNYELDRTVYGYFNSEEAAEQAVRELRDAGFTREQISLAGRPESDRLEDITGNTSNAYETGELHARTHHAAPKGTHGGFWERVRNMFEGDAAEPYSDENTRGELATHEITGAYDYDPDDFHRSWGTEDTTGRSQYFTQQYSRSGQGVMVSVNAGDRRAEAEEILEANGADLGRNYEQDLSTSGLSTGATSTAALSGTEREAYDESLDRNELAETTAGSDFGATGTDRYTNSPQRIQLYGEVLRVHRDRIQRGEVKVRKEVVTEMQSVQVPVTREELVVERVPVTGEQRAEGAEIGQESEIRIPLSEERVSVTREPVVREEVEIGKREITGTETRQEQVRHEELRVDGDTDRLRKAS